MTSYLLSSASRLSVRGLGRAPSSPTFHPAAANSSESTTSRFLSRDGMGSLAGTIDSNGFLAEWLTYDFIGPGITSKATISRMELGSEKPCPRIFRRIRKIY